MAHEHVAMKARTPRTWPGLALVAAIGVAVAGGARSRPPAVVLWAWDRAEDLRFVDPRRVAVASLAGTVRLPADRVEVRARAHPLVVPTGTALLPVVRIETDPRREPALSGEQRAAAVQAIVALAGGPSARSLQLDFDARRRERAFYRALLIDLRARLSPGAMLSITALASWCFGDRWLDALPIDFAVPMLFRMGRDGEAVRRTLADGGDFRAAICRRGVGVSLDEPVPALPSGRPVYLFAPRAWSPDRYREALGLLRGAAG
jgi:hypothetical protein